MICLGRIDIQANLESAPAPSPADPMSDLVVRMRKVFVEEIPRRLVELALSGPDQQALGRLMHGLKGGASYYLQQDASRLRQHRQL